MLSAIQQFQNDFENSDWDEEQTDSLEKDLRKRIKELANEDSVSKHLLQKEMEFLLIPKSVKNGLTGLYGVGGTNQNGEKVEYNWPDPKTFTDEDWKYAGARFDVTIRPYGKYQYGMLLFLGKKKKDNKHVVILLDNMLELAQIYWTKSVLDEVNHTHYDDHFISVVKEAFHLSTSRHKSDSDIEIRHQRIRNLILDTINIVDVEKRWATLNQLTLLIEQYFSEFQDSAVISQILARNREACTFQGAISESNMLSIAQTAINLSNKIGLPNESWLRTIAECYEALANRRQDMVTPEFLAQSMRYYKLLNDQIKLKELHALFSKAKVNLQFGKVNRKLSTDATQEIRSRILERIEMFTSEQIVEELVDGRDLPKFSAFKRDEESRTDFDIFKMFGVSLYDKYGHKNFVVEPESDTDSAFYHSYSLAFQIPSQIYFDFFIESIRASKLKYQDIENWLVNYSWLGKSYIKIYNSYSREVTPYDLIRPGFKLIMSEFEKYLTLDQDDPVLKDHSPDFICGIDSLAPKIEYLIRIVVEEQLGMSITKIKDDNTWEHKLLTELLNDLRKFVHTGAVLPQVQVSILDDISYIDFLINHRAGMNLRNKVAHAHLDKEEYYAMHALLVMSAILRISAWNFDSTDTQ